MAQKTKIQVQNQIEKQKNWFDISFAEIQTVRDGSDTVIKFESIKKLISANATYCQRIFGIEFVCFTEKLFDVLKKMQLFAHSNHPVLFQGDHGTGKAMFANAMHNYRSGKGLTTISCQSETRKTLQQNIRTFLDDSKKDGILLSRIDYLSSHDLLLLEPLLHDYKGKKLVYLTANEDFAHNPPEIAKNIIHRAKHLAITVPSIINRLDDLYAQVIYFSMKYMNDFKIKYESINHKTLKQFLRYLWPGNTQELMLYIQTMVLENYPPVLSELMPFTSDDKSKARAFTALEESEKKIIAQHLQKNNYNKALTSRELDITINTLNAKIEKYNLNGLF